MRSRGCAGAVLTAQGGLVLMEVAFEAGAAGYEHRHPHEQVSYCLRGRFEYTLDGRVNVLSAGDSIYVPGNTLHGAGVSIAGVLLDVFTPSATTCSAAADATSPRACGASRTRSRAAAQARRRLS